LGGRQADRTKVSGWFFRPWLAPSPHPTIAAPGVKEFILTPFSTWQYNDYAYHAVP